MRPAGDVRGGRGEDAYERLEELMSDHLTVVALDVEDVVENISQPIVLTI
jgi:hypothetical protein